MPTATRRWTAPSIAALVLVIVAGVALLRARPQPPAVESPAVSTPARVVDDNLVIPAPEPNAPQPSSAASSPSGVAPTTNLAVDELMRRARKALERDPREAARLADEALRKGAGGDALYLLGAANQSLGQKSVAKQFYARCARAKGPESEECAALAETL
jgi:hypothetical protein